MTLREYKQLSAPALHTRLTVLLSRDRGNLAEILICIGVIESRKHHVTAGYPTMHDCCVGIFHMSSDEAYKRVRAARAARRFPLVLQAIADGRLHLTAVTLLAKWLTRGNVAELVEAATHRTKHEVQILIAQRFPVADVPTRLREVSTVCAVPVPSSVPARLERGAQSGLLVDVNTSQETLVPEPNQFGAGASLVLVPIDHHPLVTPLSPTRMELRCTISHEAHDDLRAIQALLGHSASGIDPAQVVEAALREMRAHLEKKKFAATDKPRASKSEPTGRYIPKQVQREVRERDGAQCTFTSSDGHRCEARTLLEFDHIRPFSCGGKSTTINLRLRCHAHNQHEAERIFGEAFMARRRAESRSRSVREHVDTPQPPS